MGQQRYKCRYMDKRCRRWYYRVRYRDGQHKPRWLNTDRKKWSVLKLHVTKNLISLLLLSPIGPIQHQLVSRRHSTKQRLFFHLHQLYEWKYVRNVKQIYCPCSIINTFCHTPFTIT